MINKIKTLLKPNLVCPICGFKGKYFYEAGEPSRVNAQCPKCKSLERTRMIWHFLVNQKNIENAKLKLLHIAPDRGFFDKFSSMNNIEYTAGDYFAEGYSYENGVINLDITNLQFDDNSFDALICVHVLEHIKEDAKAMQEVFRVLKPSGWAILQVPLDKKRASTYEDWTITSPEERIKHFGQFDHVRWYGLDYKNRLEKAGFKVNIIDYFTKLGSKKSNQMALMPNDDIYFCQKK